MTTTRARIMQLDALSQTAEGVAEYRLATDEEKADLRAWLARKVRAARADMLDGDRITGAPDQIKRALDE